MKPITTPFVPLLVSAIVSIAATQCMAQAAPDGPDAPPPPALQHRPHREDMAHDAAQYLAGLKERLHLSAAQESLWNTFLTSVMPEKNRPDAPDARPDFNALAQLATPERIARMRALRQAHEANLIERENAIKSFYSGLNSDQKKIFDAERPPRPNDFPPPHHPGEAHGGPDWR